ncbi:hypothetical protein SAMN02983003_3308 [Devosia enhydra]|uniref:Invasion protein IalB, involved in pathogenesis n=1 Tax=Devosia enhydra TaxID=665118 RepID=A0A1K2I172_9HYPH|nr:hypothetical protein [Devosia enhydra]SFZ86134.1 hypothetical protein SAMN02983003_3308 [Devosia enhydra]
MTRLAVIALALLASSAPALAAPWVFETGSGRDGRWAEAQSVDVSGIYKLSLFCWLDEPDRVTLSLAGALAMGTMAPGPVVVSVDGAMQAPMSSASIAQITSVDGLDEPALLDAVVAMRDAWQLIRIQTGMVDTTFTAEGARDAIGELMSWCG